MADREAALKEVARGFRDLARVCVKLEAAFGDLATEPREPRQRARKSEPPSFTEAARAIAQSPREELTKTERRIMIPLAQSGRELSAKQIGVWSGLSSKTGTFRAALTSLRSSGFIVGDVGSIRVTDEGLAALGTYPALPEGHARFAYWCEKLNGTCKKILPVIRLHDPAAQSAREIGDRCGLSNFAKPLPPRSESTIPRRARAFG